MPDFLSPQTKQKFVKLTRTIEKGKGKLSLFGVFLVEADRWDVVAAAPWLNCQQAKGIRYIAKKINDIFSEQERLHLSRVAVVSEHDPGIASLTSAINVDGSDVEIQNCDFNGITIKRALVTVCRPAQTHNKPGKKRKKKQVMKSKA